MPNTVISLYWRVNVCLTGLGCVFKTVMEEFKICTVRRMLSHRATKALAHSLLIGHTEARQWITV